MHILREFDKSRSQITQAAARDLYEKYTYSLYSLSSLHLFPHIRANPPYVCLKCQLLLHLKDEYSVSFSLTDRDSGSTETKLNF